VNRLGGRIARACSRTSSERTAVAVDAMIYL
jgi:hypothetical protein